MTHRTREMALPALLISGSLVLAAVQAGCVSQASQANTEPAATLVPPSFSEAVQVARSPDELNQLVAPIALYPDALVAQIVAAASYPTEVVEADRWIQQNSGLKGEELAKAADSQSWDPSVKALVQFPSVLATMDKNLSWTSALGEAYVNQPQNVLNAVQVMRQRAQTAGNLKSTPQEAVATDGQTIVIQPADPDVVYVPEYDPWNVYGEPLAFYPGWVGVPGAFVGPGIAFGLGVGVGVFGGFGWGWHHWGADWHGREVTYNHNIYHSHSPTFINRNRPFGDHGHFDRGSAGLDHPGFGHPGGFAGRAPAGDHSNAFSGFNHGGVAGAYSSRGRASLGGGSHGGGGFHGGGSHGGGGHR
ncbi:MAG TPA: DUF3300 domain-containing protein [Steroidobacteraceae bacterium]|nr:DUF3300 domain-containing protein [Steroidobacteraceae bacterium]